MTRQQEQAFKCLGSRGRPPTGCISGYPVYPEDSTDHDRSFHVWKRPCSVWTIFCSYHKAESDETASPDRVSHLWNRQKVCLVRHLTSRRHVILMTHGFFAESNVSGFFGSYNPEKWPNDRSGGAFSITHWGLACGLEQTWSKTWRSRKPLPAPMLLFEINTKLRLFINHTRIWVLISSWQRNWVFPYCRTQKASVSH